MRRDPVDVLVVGAGSTGLALALQAVDHGASVSVVEQRPDAFRPSRALIVHPRTLEVLRPLGVSDALVDRGDVTPRADLHLSSHVVRAQLDAFDLPDTAFPHLLLIRQTDLEAVLSEALTRRGVPIERGTTVTRAERCTNGVVSLFALGEHATWRPLATRPDQLAHGQCGRGLRGGQRSSHHPCRPRGSHASTKHARRRRHRDRRPSSKPPTAPTTKALVTAMTQAGRQQLALKSGGGHLQFRGVSRPSGRIFGFETRRSYG